MTLNVAKLHFWCDHDKINMDWRGISRKSWWVCLWKVWQRWLIINVQCTWFGWDDWMIACAKDNLASRVESEQNGKYSVSRDWNRKQWKYQRRRQNQGESAVRRPYSDFSRFFYVACMDTSWLTLNGQIGMVGKVLPERKRLSSHLKSLCAVLKEVLLRRAVLNSRSKLLFQRVYLEVNRINVNIAEAFAI